MDEVNLHRNKIREGKHLKKGISHVWRAAEGRGRDKIKPKFS